MLTENLANEIVTQTMNRLNRNINIMNESGIIIASGNAKRLNQTHFGAIEVLKTGQSLIIQESNQGEWPGAQPGINLPITFQHKTIGVIGITGNPEEIMEFGELVKMITEMMVHQAFLTVQIEWKQRLKESLFEDLLSNPVPIKKTEKRLQLVNFQLEAPFQVGIVEIKQRKNDMLQLAEKLLPAQQALIGFLNVNRLFILTSNFSEHRFREKLNQLYRLLNATNYHPKIGVGLPVIEQSNIQQSYSDALCAIKYSTEEQPIIMFSEIETKALLEQLNKHTKEHFCKRVIGALPEKYIETLEQFIEHDLNIEKCSRSMYIHRNSLIYRLKKIEECTGYNPQNINDIITLQLALWMRNIT